jgi:hypothetical protein
MPYDWKTELPGILAIHADTCPRRNGGACICGPLGYRASFTDPTGRQVLSPEFESVAEAQAWERDQHHAVEASVEVSAAALGAEVGAVIDDFLQDAETGRARDRRGARYEPDRLRQLRASLSYVDSSLGTMELDEVRHRHVQGLIDQLRASGATNDRVTSVAAALRSLYAYAIQRDLVGYSPVVELDLPEPELHEPSTNGYDAARAPSASDTLTDVLAHAVRPPARETAEPQERHSDAMPIETVMWWAIRSVVLIFILIALVLVAESV